jgi:hypothetical protein
MRFLLLTSCSALTGIALTACVMAPTITPAQMVDGKPGFIVNCSGSSDTSACYEAAATACNGGKYTVYAKADQVRYAGNTGWVNRSLRLACDTPVTPAPQG